MTIVLNALILLAFGYGVGYVHGQSKRDDRDKIDW